RGRTGPIRSWAVDTGAAGCWSRSPPGVWRDSDRWAGDISLIRRSGSCTYARFAAGSIARRLAPAAIARRPLVGAPQAKDGVLHRQLDQQVRVRDLEWPGVGDPRPDRAVVDDVRSAADGELVGRGRIL